MTELATFAGGCFWCTEAIFQNIKGVSNVVSGYSGGEKENPNYEQVSGESTGHAETIQITFDPQVVKYSDLLYIFLKMHDPTTKDRQGADHGTQYRSVIFYHDEDQRQEAEKAIKNAQADYKDKIVTELTPYKVFYVAENHHQDYYNKNGETSYCKLVIDPKIEKLKKDFGKYLKN